METTSCPFHSIFFSSLQSHVAVGSGEPGGDEYHSLVLYHNNSPRWAEQIKLPIPVDMFRGSHVRFEFRHCSSKFSARLRIELMESLWKLCHGAGGRGGG